MSKLDSLDTQIGVLENIADMTPEDAIKYLSDIRGILHRHDSIIITQINRLRKVQQIQQQRKNVNLGATK